ncbi:MAG: rod shape-determining protein RodA [Spirochaetales bacterium]|nr:rod shape-determining protein RodA [Spirochaetales bacterium]
MKTRSFFRFDFIILLCAIGLSVIGILFIYSSAISSDGVLQNHEYIKQIVWACAGIAIMFGMSFINYEKLKAISWYFYIIMTALLAVVLIVGNVVNGAKSWLSFMGIGFQPSEFMKLAVIIRLACYFESSRDKQSDIVRFMLSLVQTGIPMLLILIQPDMGTAMVLIPIYLIMAYVAGIKKRYLVFLLSAGALSVIGIMVPAWDIFIVTEKSVQLAKILASKQTLLFMIGSSFIIFIVSGIGFLVFKKRYYYWICFIFLILIAAFTLTLGAGSFIKEYQLKRLIIFLDPQVDPRGAGWNVIQSITAVGSGGPSGKGYLKGTQSHYRYLPQQSTDFIFSIIAEEWGFIGCSIVFLLFLIIMIRCLYILLSAKEPFALYVGAGIVAMIFFHFLVNIGMAMGIMPITGIPLLLVSYGGSSMLNTMACLGIVSSIYLHKYKY